MTERYRDKERERTRVWNNSRWIGQEPGKQTSIFFNSISFKGSWELLFFFFFDRKLTRTLCLCRRTKRMRRVFMLSFCCGPSKWVNTWEGAEKISRDWDSFVLIKEHERRDKLKWLETQDEQEWRIIRKRLLVFYNWKQAGFMCLVVYSTSSFTWFSNLWMGPFFILTNKHFLNLNWFCRLHVEQCN